MRTLFKIFYLCFTSFLVIINFLYYEVSFSGTFWHLTSNHGSFSVPATSFPWQHGGFDHSEIKSKHGAFAENVCTRKKALNADGGVIVDKSPATSFNTISELSQQNFTFFLKPGGLYVPLDCKPNCTTAIIIPYKNREEQLRIFLRHMHPILARMNIAYRVFVIEQNDAFPFNRAKLFNVGYKEATTTYSNDRYTCFVFHDVDLLLENELNNYCCEDSPRYMCPAIDIWGYSSFSPYSFGGVVGIKRQDFEHVNGYSNKYWGWGSEDDDLFWRLYHRQLKVVRPPMDKGRYQMLSHKKQPRNGKAILMLKKTEKGSRDAYKDGLSTLKYRVKTRLNMPLFTHLLVDLEMTPSEGNLTDVKSGI